MSALSSIFIKTQIQGLSDVRLEALCYYHLSAVAARIKGGEAGIQKQLKYFLAP